MSAHATQIAPPLFKVPTNPNPSHVPAQHAQHTPKAPPSQAQPYYPPQGVSTSANLNSVQAPPSYSQTPYATNQEKKMSSYPVRDNKKRAEIHFSHCSNLKDTKFPLSYSKRYKKLVIPNYDISTIICNHHF
jgi:hypothetical protein